MLSTESANKSGPSGGLAGGMAFVSLARGAKIRPNCAITGQVALYGAIVKVSGIAEKTKAACDARMQYLVLPEWNRVDFEAIPARGKRTKDKDWKEKELCIIVFMRGNSNAVRCRSA
ncbi:hypothetical protein niasHT_026980 [Heterodera trifolii]|uniref:Lon proteolytic domain-containing protein n=1 Tax=Heterodera trifolii TaxID=157864 RepID=A0ABD2KRM7_9BILA